ncbi:MAG: hypothetical protein HY026_08930 [Deltaproteobacteria bacterium]|nr:hypothetical protein [Deltaproteobacteria bacterium]
MKRFLSSIIILTFIFILGISISYAYDEVEVKDGGQIIGHVKFTGAQPKLDPIKVNKNQDYCGNEKASEALIVGKDGAVKYAVGYLDKIEKGKPIDRKKQTDLDQKKCAFGPHVSTMIKGTELAVINSDPILHNININVDGIQRMNKGQPKQNQVVVARLRHIGQGDITCDSHTHMRGYIHIFDHPYHAVTDDAGSFTIDNIPPGKYMLKVWHESWKLTGHDDDGRPLYDKPILLTKEVEVPAKGIAHVNFELK